MKKYIFKIVIAVFPFFTVYSQSDTVCNPSFEDSLNSWGLINNGSSVSTLSISSDSLYSGNLGLIYDVKVNQENVVEIKMTLTTPNCPVAESLPKEVEDSVKGIKEVKDAKLELVWEPPWDKSMMSEAAKFELNL